MMYDEPPEENDLGQNAVPLTKLSLDNYGPGGIDYPPRLYEVCTVCGFVYKRTQMRKYKSRWYCKPQGCYEDIVGMRLKESPEDSVKSKRLSNRFYTRGS